MQRRLGRPCAWVLLSIAVSCFGAFGQAEPPAGLDSQTTQADSGGADLLQLAQNAKQQFEPLPEGYAAEAKQRLRKAVEKLEPFLGGAGQENGDLWKKYLRWSVLNAELTNAEKPNLRELQPIASRFFRNHEGLELPIFVAVRTSLMKWLSAAALTRDSQLETRYQQRLDQLIEWLPQYASHPTVDAGIKIGRTMGWLQNAGQADRLVKAIQQRYRQPNLVAEVSERLVAAGMQTDVEDQVDVQDCILGTSISGHATMHGETSMQFVDNPDAATFELTLDGTIASNTLGFNRGVTIHSVGSTNVTATKQLTLDSSKIDTSPAMASCSTNTTVCSISAKSCLVEKLARRKVRRSKGQAEQIASRHAEARVQTRMDQQTEDLLTKARDAYQEKFRKPLLRRGQFPKNMDFQTLGGALKLVWCQADDMQLGAPTLPPASDSEQDLSVRVHESFVSNFARAMLGGLTITDEQLAKMLEDTGGEVPEELKPSQDTDPWSITFSSVKPVSAVFSEDSIRFAIRGRRFTRGDDVVKQTLELSAVYKLHKTPAGAHLIRQGDVIVDYVGSKGPLSTVQIAMRAVMKRKFESLFKPEFNTDGIKMPGRWEDAGMLHLNHLDANNGWVALDWVIQAVGHDVAAK